MFITRRLLLALLLLLTIASSGCSDDDSSGPEPDAGTEMDADGGTSPDSTDDGTDDSEAGPSDYAAELAGDGLPATGVYQLKEYRDSDEGCGEGSVVAAPAEYFAIRHIDRPEFSLQLFELLLCDDIADCGAAAVVDGVEGSSDSISPASTRGRVSFNPTNDECTIESGTVTSLEPTEDGYRFAVADYTGPLTIEVENPDAVACRDEILPNLDDLTCASIEEYVGVLVDP